MYGPRTATSAARERATPVRLFARCTPASCDPELLSNFQECHPERSERPKVANAVEGPPCCPCIIALTRAGMRQRARRSFDCVRDLRSLTPLRMAARRIDKQPEVAAGNFWVTLEVCPINIKRLQLVPDPRS